MFNRLGIKILTTCAATILGSYSCVAMDSVTCGKVDSSQRVNSQKLIDGTFDELGHKIIQKMLNDLYDKKDFDNLVGQIDRLNSLGGQINQSDILVKLFNSIQEYYRSQNNPLKTCEQLEKAVKKIGIVPTGLKEWARRELDQLYCWASTSIWGKSSDMTAFCQLYQSVLAGDLINNDYYQIGMILYICPESRKKGVEFLEKYLGQMRDMNPDDEMIISSCSLNFLQDQTSSIDHIATLNVSPEKLIDWARKSYNKLEFFNKGISYYVYDYIVNHCRTSCSFEDYLMKDFLFCKKNNYPSSYLVFASDKDKQFLSPTFSSLSQLFTFSELKNFYENFAKKNIDQKKTRPLAFFSLLCLREFINHQKEDNFDITLNILDSQMKYSTYPDSVSLRIEDNLFESACQSYAQRRRINTTLNSYRLGKMAYKIVRKWENYGMEDIDEFKESYFVKKLRSSKELFLGILKENPLPVTLSKSYYYLSLIKSMEKDTKAAKEYLDDANFWKDEGQSKKIASLRLQIAKSAFAEKNYSEALNQYNQTHNITPTRKQVRNFWFLRQIFYPYVGEKCEASAYHVSFDHQVYEKYMLLDYQINTLGILDKESDVIKLLCLNKLGYKDAADHLFQNLLEDKESDNLFLLPLFESAKNEQDNESICLLYKLMKHHGCYLKDKIDSYLSAQFNLSNFEEVCTEAEAHLSGRVDDSDVIQVLHHLIRAYSHLGQQEKFSANLMQYINLCEKYLRNTSEKQGSEARNKENDIRYEYVKLLNELILRHIMCGTIQKELVMDLIGKFLLTSLPIRCDSRIRMAQIFSVDNNHQAAYKSLSKAVCFKQRGIELAINQKKILMNAKIGKDFENAHNVLKMAFPQIISSLIQLEKWNEIDGLVGYLKKQHQITIKITRNNKNIKENVPENIRRHLINSFLEQSKINYQEATNLNKNLNEITLHEWQKLKGIDPEELVGKAKDIFSLCTKNFEILSNIMKGNDISPKLMEEARKSYDNFNKNICQLNQVLSKPLIKISVLRKKEVHRKFLEENYQISEINFLDGSGSRENYRASQKLREIQNQQKQALIEAKQKLRQQNRAHLEEAYQENLSNKGDIEEEIPSDTLLTECKILPSNPMYYSPEDSMLLHQILSKKFNLNDRDQETLRIILTGGERTFQITLNHIIKLFSKFVGFTDDVHHGGSHEKVSGMGLTLMPNANGIKKGSYRGQIEEAKEKIIMIIAKTLMVKDLPSE